MSELLDPEIFRTVLDALQTGVSGIVAQIVDSSKAFKNLNGTITLATVVLIIVLLLAIYRSVILVFVPLISVGLAYAVSAGLFGLIARAFNIIVNPQSTSLAIVLILGCWTPCSRRFTVASVVPASSASRTCVSSRRCRVFQIWMPLDSM